MQIPLMVVLLGVLIAPSIAVAQDAVDQCRTVADVMGRDEARETFDLKVLDMVYQQTCSGKTTKSGLDFSSESTTFVDLVPVSSSFKFGARKEKAEHICATYDSTRSMQLYRDGATSTVVREAIDAWKLCVIANKDVSIRIQPTSSAGTFFFELKRGGEDAIFNGVKVKEGSITCTATVPNGQGGKADRIITSSEQIMITPEKLTVACARGIEEHNGLEYMPQTSFLIDTTRGSIPVVLPRDAKFGPLYGTQLMRYMQDSQLASQQNIDRLLARKPEFWRGCGKYQLMVNGGDPAPACPAGYTRAFEDQFVHNGGCCGVGQNCRVCYKMVDP